MKKPEAMVDLARRLKARREAGLVTSESLSRLIREYLQQVQGESGELNVNFGRLVARRGAPFGNQNRLTHGGRTREMDELRADVRAHIERSRAHIATAASFGRR